MCKRPQTSKDRKQNIQTKKRELKHLRSRPRILSGSGQGNMIDVLIKINLYCYPPALVGDSSQHKKQFDLFHPPEQNIPATFDYFWRELSMCSTTALHDTGSMCFTLLYPGKVVVIVVWNKDDSIKRPLSHSLTTGRKMDARVAFHQWRQLLAGGNRAEQTWIWTLNIYSQLCKELLVMISLLFSDIGIFRNHPLKRKM